MRASLFLFVLSLFVYHLPAQDNKSWSIDECVNYALENNIQIRQSQLQAQINKNNREAAHWDYAPSLNAGTGYNWNFGLNIDPVTNQISQRTRQTASLSLTSNWVLYDGGRKYNSIYQANQNYIASLYALEDAKNDISLNVASFFLQILLNREILSVALEQERITQLQLNRTKKLVDAGSRPLGDQLQLEAQLARDKQNRIASENSLTISKLQLANLLQLENPDDFAISDPAIEVPDAAMVAREPGSIYATALENQPSIKGAESRLKSSEHNVEIARGGFRPTLSVVGQVSTNYSDQIVQPTGTVEQQPVIGEVVGTNQQVISAQPQTFFTGIEDKPFTDQVNDNLNEFIGINLSIPIFNRFQVKNSYQNSKLAMEQSRLQLEQEKNTLRQTIYQAHADAKASYNSYLAAEKAVESSTESFKYAKERYEVGALNQFDFENAKNSLAVSQSDMARAKYDYIFKIKVLEFYLTNQINL